MNQAGEKLAPSNSLAEIATGRSFNLFADDMQENEAVLREQIEGKRVLAIGAAGSIGSSTVNILSHYKPESLHIIDHDENGLAELIRGLRSRSEGISCDDLVTLPIDFGGGIAKQFLEAQNPYDLVLNFAAIKHVRSEKDPFSSLQMYETNIRKQALFCEWMRDGGFKGRYFAVSTDKAANPSSLMGASKRALERVLFSNGITGKFSATTSARFANVAFSNGSLPQSFQRRLERQEALAVPAEVTRYFVSLEESGCLCTLASVIAPDRHIAIPALNPEDHLVPLRYVAERFLRYHGLEPIVCDDEEEARALAVKCSQQNTGQWPLLVTPLNTAGEKPYEEFVADGERSVDIGLKQLRAVPYEADDEKAVGEFLEQIKQLLDGNVELSPEAIEAPLIGLEPKLSETRKRSALNLDQRM